NATLPRIGEFDAVFLRNVMIYFDTQTKRQVVDRILTVLRPGGYFFIGHSESLQGLTEQVTMVQPTVYRKLYHMRKPTAYLEIFLQPGEWYFGDADTRIRTLLGSCVAITMWHPRRCLGGMCH